MLRRAVITSLLLSVPAGCLGSVNLGDGKEGVDAGVSSCTGAAPLCYGKSDTECCSHDPTGVAVCKEGAWMCGSTYAPGCSGQACACDASTPLPDGGVSQDAGTAPDGGDLDGGLRHHRGEDGGVDASSGDGEDASEPDGGLRHHRGEDGGGVDASSGDGEDAGEPDGGLRHHHGEDGGRVDAAAL